MKTLTIEQIKDFETLVNEMELNTKYIMPVNSRYKWIKIERNNNSFNNEIVFMWAMEYNYSVAGYVGYIYPYGGTNKVKHFKTEKGAKRNIIKLYQDYFNSLNQPNEN